MATSSRTSLPTVSNRCGVLLLEHARIAVTAGSVVAGVAESEFVVPIESLAALLLGPGTSLTQQAALRLADAAVTVVWTGSGLVRSYGSIVPLAASADMLHRQVRAWADRQQRLTVARRMYSLRFPEEDSSRWTLSELRAAEGRRVRRRYREACDQRGLTWPGRESDWDRADDLNRSITAAYQSLYGAAHCAIQALGMHPALGFVHTGDAQSFVYDIADLFKTSMGIDIALDVYCEGGFAGGLDRAVRTRMNVEIRTGRVLAGMVAAVAKLLDAPAAEIRDLYIDDLQLFDPRGNVPAGVNYADLDVPYGEVAPF